MSPKRSLAAVACLSAAIRSRAFAPAVSLSHLTFSPAFADSRRRSSNAWIAPRPRTQQCLAARRPKKLFPEDEEEVDEVDVVGVLGDEPFDDLDDPAELDGEDEDLDLDNFDELDFDDEQDIEEDRAVQEKLAQVALEEKRFAQQVLQAFPDVPVVEVDRYGNRVRGADPYEGRPELLEKAKRAEDLSKQAQLAMAGKGPWPEVRGDTGGMDDPADAPWRVEAESIIRESVESAGLVCHDVMWSFHKLEVTVVLPGMDQDSPEAGYVDSDQLLQAIKAVNAGLQEREEDLWVLNRHELVVATPGAKDILTTDREFKAFRGFEVVVKTGGPFKNKRELEGKLVERTFDELHIMQRGRKVRIPLALVEEVRLPAAQYEPGDIMTQEAQ